MPAVVAPAAELTLKDAVTKALQNNLGLQSALFEPYIAEAGVVAADARFDFVFGSELSWALTEERAIPGDPVDSRSDNRSYSIGASKLLPFGTIVSVDTRLGRSDSRIIREDGSTTASGPFHDAELGFQVRQPLLQGAGRDVNLAGVRIAESQLTEAELRLRATALDVVAGAEDRYWVLSYAYARYELLQSALQVAEQFVEETRERERAGLVTRVDLLEAQSAYAARLEEIVLARQDIADATDALLAFLGLLQDPAISSSYVDVDALPMEHPQPPAFEEFWPRVVLEDADTASQEEVINRLLQDKIVARDATRPLVDAIVGGAYTGRDRDRSVDAYRSAFDRDGEYVMAGVSIDWPWKNRQANARLRQTQGRIEQAKIGLVDLRQDLLYRSRLALREVSTGLERLEASTASVELAAAAFEQAKARYDRGLITFRSMLEAQRDYDAARLSHLQANLNVIRGEVAVHRLQGTILERHGLTFSPAITIPTDY